MRGLLAVFASVWSLRRGSSSLCSLEECKTHWESRNMRLLQPHLSTRLEYTVVWYKLVIHQGRKQLNKHKCACPESLSSLSLFWPWWPLWCAVWVLLNLSLLLSEKHSPRSSECQPGRHPSCCWMLASGLQKRDELRMRPRWSPDCDGPEADGPPSLVPVTPR